MQNFREYLVSEMREAGLNDDQVISALDKIVNHEKLGSKLNSIVKTATEDYNAQVGRVQSLQERNNYLENVWYPEANATASRYKSEYDKAMAELNNIRAGAVAPNFDPSAYMTKADMESMLANVGQRLGTVVKDVGRIASRHAVVYKEELDTDALDQLAVKMAQERGLAPGSIPIADVYEKFVEPRRKAAEEDGRKKWEAETRAQLERDIRSQYNVPAAANPVEQSQMFRPTPEDQRPKDMDMDLLAHWNGVAQGA